MKKYCIIGTDKRSLALRRLYREEGHSLVSYDLADYVIAPMPFSKDDIKVNGEILECEELIEALKDTNKVLFSGAISQEMKKKLEANNVCYHDLLSMENVAILNAIPTSEGAIQVAMEITDFTIHNSNVMVLGYGRIGKVLSHMLSGLGAHVYCEARKEKDIALMNALGYNSVRIQDLDSYLPKMDIIFNTIPVKILTSEKLELLKRNCAIIDLASSPGGVDLDKAKMLGISVNWALALPAKVAPVTAALYLKETIDLMVEA